MAVHVPIVNIAIMSARRYEALIEELEDARDRLSLYEREGDTLSFDEVKAELGLD